MGISSPITICALSQIYRYVNVNITCLLTLRLKFCLIALAQLAVLSETFEGSLDGFMHSVFYGTCY